MKFNEYNKSCISLFDLPKMSVCFFLLRKTNIDKMVTQFTPDRKYFLPS